MFLERRHGASTSAVDQRMTQKKAIEGIQIVQIQTGLTPDAEPI
jgi:hypothetical protein